MRTWFLILFCLNFGDILLSLLLTLFLNTCTFLSAMLLVIICRIDAFSYISALLELVWLACRQLIMHWISSSYHSYLYHLPLSLSLQFVKLSQLLFYSRVHMRSARRLSHFGLLMLLSMKSWFGHLVVAWRRYMMIMNSNQVIIIICILHSFTRRRSQDFKNKRPAQRLERKLVSFYYFEQVSVCNTRVWIHLKSICN